MSNSRESSAKLWRLVFALTRLVATGVAMVLVIGGIVVYATEPLSLLLPRDGLVTVLAGGSVTALLAFTSFLVIGVRKRTDGSRGARMRWVVIDALLMAAMATAFILAAVMTLNQSASLPPSTKHTFSRFWSTASPTMITLIQSDGQCCGFDGYSDRILEPCSKYAQAVGCWTVLRDEYMYYLHLLAPALIVLAVLCSTCSILAFILIVLRLHAANKQNDQMDHQEEAFQINRSEPFDAWHKAIFA